MSNLSEEGIIENQTIILDVIPIYEDEMFPTQAMWWHFRDENYYNQSKETIIEYMLQAIKRKFSDCKAIIVLEKGMVIKVL